MNMLVTAATDPTTNELGSDLAGKLPSWGVGILGVLFIILAVTDRLSNFLGKIGAMQEDRIKAARRVATEKDDGDIAELRRQVGNLKGMLTEEQQVNHSYRKLIVELYQYILNAQRDPSNLRNTVPEPVIEEQVRNDARAEQEADNV